MHVGASKALLGKAAGTHRKRPFPESGPSRLICSKSLLTRCCHPPAAATGARPLPGGPAAAEPPGSPQRLRQPRGPASRGDDPPAAELLATPSTVLLWEGRAAQGGADQGWGHGARGARGLPSKQGAAPTPSTLTATPRAAARWSQRCPAPGALREVPGQRPQRGPYRAQTQHRAGGTGCASGGANL